MGITTENVAHRFAVEWDDEAGSHAGVFIPRRATNSRITALAGDRVFPGAHQLARFEVEEQGGRLFLGVRSEDGSLGLSVAAHESTEMDGSIFTSLDDAVDFFRTVRSATRPAALQVSSSESVCGARVGMRDQWRSMK